MMAEVSSEGYGGSMVVVGRRSMEETADVEAVSEGLEVWKRFGRFRDSFEMSEGVNAAEKEASDKGRLRNPTA